MYVCTWVGRCFVILGDHVTRLCNMESFRNHTPQIIISLSVSTFLDHSKSSTCSPSRSTVRICLFFLCRETQKHCGHQPQSHNAVSLSTSIMHPIIWCYVITECVNIYFQCVWDRYGRRKSHLKANDTILWTVRTIQPSGVYDFSRHCAVQMGSVARLCMILRKAIVFTLALLGYAVARLVEALRCKPEGRWFDSRCDFSLT